MGQKLLDGLASRGHKPKELLLGASSRSAGQTRMFHNEELTVQIEVRRRRFQKDNLSDVVYLH